MKNIFNFEQFLNENNEHSMILSEIVDNEIRVYEKTIKGLFSFVGEGIDEIEPISIDSRGTHTQGIEFTTFLTNEVKVTFIDNAWGGISLEEWGKSEDILKGFLGMGGFEDYSISPTTNTITLIFSQDMEMGLY
jgi:hypothetical protein